MAEFADHFTTTSRPSPCPLRLRPKRLRPSATNGAPAWAGSRTGAQALDFNQDFDAGQLDALMWPLVGTNVALVIRPDSAAVGAANPQFTGNAILMSYPPLGNSVGELATGSITLEGNGPLVRAGEGNELTTGGERMTYLSRDTILQREDIVTEDVEVPEWGGTVRVRGMSGVERDAFEASLIVQPEEQANGKRKRRRQQATKTSMANVRAKLCAWCIIDENGAKLFSDADVVALGAKSAAALDRIYAVASELSGITDEDVEEIAEEMIEDPFDETSTP